MLNWELVDQVFCQDCPEFNSTTMFNPKRNHQFQISFLQFILGIDQNSRIYQIIDIDIIIVILGSSIRMKYFLKISSGKSVITS